MAPNPNSSPSKSSQSDEQLKQNLLSAFTADTPETIRIRIAEAIIEALNEPEDD